MSGLDERVIPDFREGSRPVEMARIWIDAEEGRSHVSLKYGMFEENELEMWGCLAADLIAHVVQAHILYGAPITPDQGFAAVAEALRERIASNPTLEGRFPDRMVS